MTETSSMLTVLRPEPKTFTTHGNSGYPVPGASVSVGDRPAQDHPPGTQGDIWVTGPMVAEATIDGMIARTDGWMRTGDVGALGEDGSLTVIGRRDDVIVTGGEKVLPSEVEEVLTRHAAIAEAVVVGIPDAEWGQRVVAFLVVTDDAPDDDTIRTWMKEMLSPAKCPKAFHRVPSMPLTSVGKPDRAAMRVLAGAAE
jgi:O-succinylbenzoic acid--CoA ligase